jgi:PIN domain nuclease of toxin-antitoxin system
MRLLLDTHAFIWYVEDDLKLPATAKSKIKSPDNEVLISTASLWEIGIKTSLNKLTVGSSMAEIFEMIFKNGFEVLPILPSHIVKNNALPFHHRDPFDRMIIAQALVDTMEVVSKDEIFDKYGITRFWK